MNRLVLTVSAVLFFVSGCGDAGVGSAEPVGLSADLLTATRDGDNQTWRDAYAANAKVTFPDGTTMEVFGEAPYPVDDFDGDGVGSFADDMQFRNALHEPAGQTMTWECSEIAADQSECTTTASDKFIEAGGGAPLVTTTRTTFHDGKVIKQEFLEPTDDASMQASQDAHAATMSSYEQWVLDTHPDLYKAVFHGPCCDSALVGSADAITIHAELMPTYFASHT